MPHKFGALHTRPCLRCSAAMRINRRAPELGRESTHEHQTFACLHCDYEECRIVNEDGAEDRLIA